MAKTPRPNTAAMRTRLFECLSTYEIAAYLRRNDVIYLPVGTIEMHGQMPVGAEHVFPLALAARLAERTDGLVLSGLVYFYPGSTAVGAGTVQVSPTAGMAYLREVCRSLLRQGFRRQVLLTAHGPAHVTCAPFVREFFEETHCPIVYIDLGGPIAAVNAQARGAANFDKMIWGAYHLLGRLDEVQPKPAGRRSPDPEPTVRLRRHFAQFGYYLDDVTQHGWWPAHALSPEQRLARAREGVEHIDRVIAALAPDTLLPDLANLDAYLRTKAIPQYARSSKKS